jgi:hypothetical protein
VANGVQHYFLLVLLENLSQVQLCSSGVVVEHSRYLETLHELLHFPIHHS